MKPSPRTSTRVDTAIKASSWTPGKDNEMYFCREKMLHAQNMISMTRTPFGPKLILMSFYNRKSEHNDVTLKLLEITRADHSSLIQDTQSCSFLQD